MSRNSKKGFKRLNTHELVEFNRNGMQECSDSASESEILDLTKVASRGSRYGRCSGCCVWFGILYVGVLTILLLLLGVFSGYILVNMWQMNKTSNSTHNELRAEIQQLRKDYEVHTHQTFYLLNGLKETTFAVNNSIELLNGSFNATVHELRDKLNLLDLRLKVIEGKPQEVLIKQVDSIHEEMNILNSHIQRLNNSLDEFQDMRQQMAGMGSLLNSYDGRIRDLSATVGDTVHGDTDIHTSIHGLADRLKNHTKYLSSLESQMKVEHDKMQQSSDLTAAQFSNLQSLVSAMNMSARGEMGQMWTNMTHMESMMEELEIKIGSLAANLSSLGIRSHDKQVPQTEFATSYFPMPILPTSTPSTQPNPQTTLPESISTTSPLMDTTTTEPQETTAPSTSNSSSPLDSQPTGGATEDSPNTVQRSSGGEDSDSNGALESTDGEDHTIEPPVASTSAAEVESDSSEGRGLKKLEAVRDEFSVFDENDDDLLSYDEFPMHQPKLFDLMDVNRDRFLSRKEILDAIRILESGSSKDSSDKKEQRTKVTET